MPAVKIVKKSSKKLKTKELDPTTLTMIKEALKGASSLVVNEEKLDAPNTLGGHIIKYLGLKRPPHPGRAPRYVSYPYERSFEPGKMSFYYNNIYYRGGTPTLNYTPGKSISSTALDQYKKELLSFAKKKASLEKQLEKAKQKYREYIKKSSEHNALMRAYRSNTWWMKELTAKGFDINTVKTITTYARTQCTREINGVSKPTVRWSDRTWGYINVKAQKEWYEKANTARPAKIISYIENQILLSTIPIPDVMSLEMIGEKLSGYAKKLKVT